MKFHTQADGRISHHQKNLVKIRSHTSAHLSKTCAPAKKRENARKKHASTHFLLVRARLFTDLYQKSFGGELCSYELKFKIS